MLYCSKYTSTNTCWGNNKSIILDVALSSVQAGAAVGILSSFAPAGVLYYVVTTVPLAVGYGALNLWVRSLDR